MMDATRSHGTVQNALAIPISKPESSPYASRRGQRSRSRRKRGQRDGPGRGWSGRGSGRRRSKTKGRCRGSKREG